MSEKEDIASRNQPCADAQERSPEAQRSGGEANHQTPRVLPILRGDADFITAALSWYRGKEVWPDIERAWSHITGAISAHGAWASEREHVARAAMANADSALASTPTEA
jgi:hypothetical protein